MDDYYIKGMVPLGKLSVLPPKPVKHESQNSNAITDPYGVIHTHHVKYDHLTRSYKGLPPEWEAQLKRQFGLPPNRVETMKLDKYTSRIPCVLVQMKEYLFKHGGLESEGIFRLAPDADESTFVKQQLNENSFEKCRDINCISNLIKVWFRELPDHLLNPVNKDAITSCDDEDAAGRIIPTMPEPNQSIYLWLLDLCVEVAAHSSVNKMTAQNLAVVIAPNLFAPDNSDPMKTLMYSQKVSQFLYRSILWREKTTK